MSTEKIITISMVFISVAFCTGFIFGVIAENKAMIAQEESR